ncbi:nucleoside triphosphate pyrophosphohydrolase [Planococcus sp. N028]|uniref:Nucleoside triphosphate pyrophosphohydrolase n=1 Tax=Planococcus shixiaomingii TaxID=3058393 RepID=A0ABT8N2U9_9BACL|nr:nucleoside triphosphate pyrophosphohydrolase [Planococcus sp. N028]MDN7242219.1 nucleoside triphosphate pyrophosphohydrolase [Planococcus sp. N028]
MSQYNKLVRDNIPEIIKRSGKEFSMLILSEEKYRIALNKKIDEELNEYYDAKDNKEAIEELADILELIQVSAETLGFSLEQLEKIRKVKAEKNGSFKKRVFLIEIED